VPPWRVAGQLFFILNSRGPPEVGDADLQGSADHRLRTADVEDKYSLSGRDLHYLRVEVVTEPLQLQPLRFVSEEIL
jgi:hypothetical protein